MHTLCNLLIILMVFIQYFMHVLCTMSNQHVFVSYRVYCCHLRAFILYRVYCSHLLSCGVYNLEKFGCFFVSRDHLWLRIDEVMYAGRLSKCYVMPRFLIHIRFFTRKIVLKFTSFLMLHGYDQN